MLSSCLLVENSCCHAGPPAPQRAARFTPCANCCSACIPQQVVAQRLGQPRSVSIHHAASSAARLSRDVLLEMTTAPGLPAPWRSHQDWVAALPEAGLPCLVLRLPAPAWCVATQACCCLHCLLLARPPCLWCQPCCPPLQALLLSSQQLLPVTSVRLWWVLSLSLMHQVPLPWMPEAPLLLRPALQPRHAAGTARVPTLQALCAWPALCGAVSAAQAAAAAAAGQRPAAGPPAGNQAAPHVSSRQSPCACMPCTPHPDKGK